VKTLFLENDAGMTPQSIEEINQILLKCRCLNAMIIKAGNGGVGMMTKP
jgi:hypothetical protein